MVAVMSRHNLGEHKHAMQQPLGWGMVYSIADPEQQTSSAAR